MASPAGGGGVGVPGGPGRGLQSESAKASALVAAAREKLAAVERTMTQAMHTPLFGSFRLSCERVLCASRLLVRLVSSLTNASPRTCAALYGLMGSLKLTHTWLAPLIVANTPPRVVLAHAREGGHLLARKLEAIRRLYAAALHELAQGLLEQRVNLRHMLARTGAGRAPGSHVGSQAGVKQYLSASIVGTGDGELTSGEVSAHAGLSSPLHFDESYFGDDSTSPYAFEKVAAARAQEMRELLHTYHEFPLYTPLNAGCSFAQRRFDDPAFAAARATSAPPPYCSDLFNPAHSPLALPADFVPSARGKEFASLRRAFAKLCVTYGSGSNVDSNRSGPRVIFIHGPAGIGAQEYAKHVMHHLLDFVPPPAPAAASAVSTATTSFHSSTAASNPTSTSAATYGPTAPPSFTSNYTPLHFAFNRHSQYAFKHRTESLMDSLARKVKSVASSSHKDSASFTSGNGGDEGAAVISAVSTTAEGGERHASRSPATTTPASSARSAIPPFEKEKLHSMHRLRADAATVMKSLLSELSKSSASVGTGGAECEAGAHITTAELNRKYRQCVLDTPTVLLISNVHKLDEGEIEKLLFPPTNGDPLPEHLLNKAVIIVQSRQPLKGLMRTCANHCIAQMLLPMDDAQTMNALLKLSERRVQLRARKLNATISTVPRLAVPVGPGHAIRLAMLCRGSVFVARLLVRNVEAGLPMPANSGKGTKVLVSRTNDVRTQATLDQKSTREVAEWLCSTLEGKPASLERYLVEHYFPASQKASIAPALSLVFASLSDSARGLFVAMAFVLAGCASFTLRTLKATFLHYEIRGGLQAAEGADEDAAEPVFRLNQLEADLRELLARGLVDQLGEFGEHGFGFAEDAAAEGDEDAEAQDEAEEERPNAVSVSVQDDETPTAVGAPTTTHAAPSLTRARFAMHEVCKEFGLAIAHSTSASSGSSDFAKHLGPTLAAKFLDRVTSERYKRSLQLNFVEHISTMVQSLEAQYSQWWLGTQNDEDHEDIEDAEAEEAMAASSYSPSFSPAGARSRTGTLSALSASERAEALRQRAEALEQRTSAMLAAEAAESQAKDSARRTSRCSVRSAADSGPRRSTLLLASRGRNESSTLPTSSLRSLPHAQPTELVFKTVTKLRSLMEDDEHEEEAKDSSPQPTPPEADAPIGSADAAVLSTTPPLRTKNLIVNPSPVSDSDSSSSGDDGAFSTDEDLTDDDEMLSAIPLAEADDVEPEAALVVATPAPTLASVGSPRAGHGRMASSKFDFSDLAAVLEVEAEDDEAEVGEYDAAEFPDSDADDSSDDDYEEVSVAARARASVAAASHDVSALLFQLHADDRRARKIARAQERAEALREAQEDEYAASQARQFDSALDMIDHGRQALPSLFTSLNTPSSLAALAKPQAAAHPNFLANLATAVMQTLVPRSATGRTVRARAATNTGSSRTRSGTTFSASAARTPSFIRSVQLARLIYTFDLELPSVMTALRYSFGCSKRHTSAVRLFAPRGLYATRLSAAACKHLYFHYLEVCKPRYSPEWLRGLWNLGQCYQSMGQLQKARDCLEEIRLIAVRQGTDGLGPLILSQIGVAAVHQAQLCAGRIAQFGAWIDAHTPPPAGSLALALSNGATSTSGGLGESLPNTAAPIAGSLAYPDVTPTPADGGGLLVTSSSTLSVASSVSTSTLASSSFLDSPFGLPLSTSPEADVGHIHSVLDAIIECYERALATLESNSLLLLSERAGDDESFGLGLGAHAFNRPLMYLLLRLGTWYTYKNAHQNALNVLQRLVEIKAAEVDFKRIRRQRLVQQHRRATLAASVPTTTVSAADTPSSSAGGLFPFTLPCTTRLLVSGLHALGIVHFRTGDLLEALEYFERARRVAATLLHARWRREKRHRDHTASTWATEMSEADEAPWLQSTSFLSGLATPQHAADVMTYVRCIYMQACSLDRMAASAPASSSSPSLPSSGWCQYRALVLRSRILAIWQRVTTDHKVVTMHEAMWQTTAGMSTLDTAAPQ